MFLRKGVLKICSKFTGEHPCRSMTSIKLKSNFIEIALRHVCSSVNLQHIFRTPFQQSTSQLLLRKYVFLKLTIFHGQNFVIALVMTFWLMLLRKPFVLLVSSIISITKSNSADFFKNLILVQRTFNYHLIGFIATRTFWAQDLLNYASCFPSAQLAIKPPYW